MKLLISSLGLIFAITATVPVMANEAATPLTGAVQTQTSDSAHGKDAATKTDAKYNAEIKNCMKHNNKTEDECKKELKQAHAKK